MSVESPSTRRALLLSRIIEQGVIGLGSLALARVLGVDDFAVPSALLIINSLTVTLSDLGLGTDVLRLGPGERAADRRLWAMRAVGSAATISGVVGGLLVGGEVGGLLAAAGILWLCSAEAFVRKSGAIRQGAVRSVAGGEILGSVVLAAAILVACARQDATLTLLVGGLIGKCVVEVVCAREWRQSFATDGVAGDQLALWVAQAVAYLVANVDFVVVGAILGDRSFAVYALAFRLSSALPSQLSYVAGRTASVDLATLPELRQQTYLRYIRPLFLAGLAASGITVALAPVVPQILGPGWGSLSWVLVVLAMATPWRMILGLAGTLLIVARRSSLLLGVELAHLVVLLGGLVVAASIGLAPFVAVAAISSVLAVLAYHRVATGLEGLKWWGALLPSSAASVVLIGLASSLVATPY